MRSSPSHSTAIVSPRRGHPAQLILSAILGLVTPEPWSASIHRPPPRERSLKEPGNIGTPLRARLRPLTCDFAAAAASLPVGVIVGRARLLLAYQRAGRLRTR